ncbi:hypothetical protein PilKf_01419 [Pillotina sp. SPG140]|jgi:uncharacterized repeat protein (TIGR02543 family)
MKSIAFHAKKRAAISALVCVPLLFGCFADPETPPPPPITVTYAVTFNTDGGSVIPEQIVAEGATVVKPANPTKDRFAFVGWYSDKALTVPYNFNTPVTSDLTLYAQWEDCIAKLAREISESPNGDSADNPVAVAVDMNLAVCWADILTTIKAADKYVALDLSACRMDGTEFDPGTASTGENKIVSLILPNAAQSIKSGDYDSATFKNFTALKEIRGSTIKNIGDFAFDSCKSLTTVSFPEATTIGDFAFSRTGKTRLNITLGATAPTVGNFMFDEVNESKTVIVKVPYADEALWKDAGYDEKWQTDFTGDNTNIKLTIDTV